MKTLHRLRIRMLRDPIQRLRLRLITVAMASVAVALVLIFAVVNLLNYRSLTERSDYLIETIYRHDGEFPDHLPPDGSFEFSQETPFETRYFMVTVSSAGSIESVDADHIASGGRDSAKQTAQDILARSRESGYWGQYRYRVYSEDDGSKTVVIVDCFVQLQSIRNLAVISAAVAGGCLAITLVLIIPISKRILRPYIENQRRQRRFVTDASHELKTPVAIITANIDLLETVDGENQWTRSTHRQAERLPELIRDLIELARADEPGGVASADSVELSRTVTRAVEDFMPLAEANGKAIDADVCDGVTVPGDPAALERLVSVLLENAIKHGDEAGDVSLMLTRARRDAELTVRNPCVGLDASETDRLFERFYRPDPSRERGTGGYGIGLSIARSVTERHGGKIRAKKVGDDLEIVVTMPLAR